MEWMEWAAAAPRAADDRDRLSQKRRIDATWAPRTWMLQSRRSGLYSPLISARRPSMPRSTRRSAARVAPGVLGFLPGLLLLAAAASAHPFHERDRFYEQDKFRQLEEVLPTPNDLRAASGAPGPAYWQQRADYEMDIELDDARQWLHGKAKITYLNRSPDRLTYLWLQLDQNLLRRDADSNLAEEAPHFKDATAKNKAPELKEFSYRTLNRLLYLQQFDGGMRIARVADAAGAALPHTIVKTMMRIDLPKPLGSGERFVFHVDWSYPINDAVKVSTRSGYEYFEKDGNYLYEIAQFFPRLAAYTDVNGWQHKQFIGRGEFTLEFGDYLVRLNVPADHVVAATGSLQNPEAVLSAAQRARLREAETAKGPVFVVTPDEARAAEKGQATARKTWVYQAENVRDFAFASSRKFIWDAWQHQSGKQKVMAMSLYPKEGEPLWSKYSTQAIVHTLEVYSRYTFEYPYPAAISVNGPVGGMEYPMICFNGPRAQEDGHYYGSPKEDGARRFGKYPLISVIIHEVGHNYFPMIVNSDERQWTWMDEGLNTFLQFLAEQEWEEEYPSRRGKPADIVEYMLSDDQVPIMTNSESILQFGANAYAKPATALNVLRETVLGRDLFDFAFKEYARRWQWKRPMPADFFRTMEDASGVDLDWFWHGWFYTTDHVDISLDGVYLYSLDTRDPVIDKERQRRERDKTPRDLSDTRNAGVPKRVDAYPELKDFYNDYDELAVTAKDRAEFEELVEGLETWEQDLLRTEAHFYVLELSNKGGLVMPLPLSIDYVDGTSEQLTLPAELWRLHSDKVRKLLIRTQEIKAIEIDRYRQTADADLDNNSWPARAVPTRFQLFKDKLPPNPMRQAAEADSAKEGAAKEEGEQDGDVKNEEPAVEEPAVDGKGGGGA
jgi:hypothetical protein